MVVNTLLWGCSSFQYNSKTTNCLLLQRVANDNILPSHSHISSSLYSTTQDGMHINKEKKRKKNEKDSSLTQEINANIHSRSLHNQENQKSIKYPNHLALILDGNGRWAREHNLPVSIGHSNGASNVISTLKYLKKFTTVECCTLYAFSTENWARSNNEIKDIWKVIEQTADSITDIAIKEGLQLKILGNVWDDRIPKSLSQKLTNLEKDTSAAVAMNMKGYDSIDKSLQRPLTVALAVNYGGRQDIIAAAQRILDAEMEHQESKNSNNNNGASKIKINEKLMAANLCTSELPPLDMVIRTGGECRMSNFLLWDAAYAELYFADTLWPDFDERELGKALEWFSNRNRRFGGRTEEL